MLYHRLVLHSFIWLNNIPLYAYNTIYLSIHQFVALVFSPTFLAIINSAALNIYVQVFLCGYAHFSWIYILGLELTC
jgi:hypothetical protein